ncbi:MAG: 50S ribosomal protein L17 [Candidatus Abyssobacteria bacterium SURF_17]|uniref:Large ribosomal subunit protein bL17 n=1 Tax=Candidatus Abyssobacteria bacterium SURF_17 TaxID=2093361 RepID=A0A419EVN6_9BACT|nr:MAG: 50S ribosomal protein L17 [Candidatus Abyssubacteria bacterium SURF_17]
MRHRNKKGKLGRTSAHREALLSNLAASLIMNGRITTTVAKTKALRSVAEKLITLGKKQDINARRQAAAILKDKRAVKKLFSEIGPQFDSRNGGYTRIIRMGQRTGDGAPMAILELVS